jgi:hypothetical protein
MLRPREKSATFARLVSIAGRMKTTTRAAALALTLVAWSLPASADDKPRATRLYQEGLAAQEKGDDALACEKYLAALALVKSYKIAANLGAAELKLGRNPAAAEHLALALELMDAGVEVETREAVAKLLTQAKGKALGVEITVYLAGEPIAAEIFVDGEARSSGRALFTTPGEHTVRASLAGLRSRDMRFAGAAGDSMRIALHLRPEGGARAPRAAADPGPGGADGPAWPLWALGGAGAAFAIAAGASLGGAFFYAGERDARGAAIAEKGFDASLVCPFPPAAVDGTCDEWRSAAATHTDLLVVGVGAAVASGLLLGGALAYALWPAPEPSVAVAAGPTGLAIMGRF